MPVCQENTKKYQKLLELGSATVCEAQSSMGVLDSRIRPIHQSMKMVGPAVTLDVMPGDNLMLHYALLKTAPGDVLVVDAKGFLGAGIWGDILAEQAVFKGLAGIVVNGAIRDTAELIKMNFPAFCKAICIKGTSKIQPGKLNVPVVIGNVNINPGDIVLADTDGIVIIPQDSLDTVLEKAIARDEKETKIRELIRAGEVTVDLLNLRNALEENNLTLD